MAIASRVPPFVSLLGRIRLRQLLLVVALERLGSLRKAAEDLGISQPAATKMLVEMEQALGLPLFERGRSGMTSTVFGEALIRHAHLVLSDVEDLRDDLAALASGAAGRLAIGTITAAAAGPLTMAVARLKELRPKLEVSIVVETSDNLLPLLEQGRLDVVIGRPVTADNRRCLDFIEIAPERLSIVVGAHNRLGDRPVQSLRQLAEAGWILQPLSSPLRQVVEATFRDAGMRTPENVVETASILVATTLLQCSDMIAVVPDSVAQHYVASGLLRILPLDVNRQLDPYGLITLRGRRDAPALVDLIDLLRAS